MHYIYKAMKARLERLSPDTLLAYGITWGDTCGCLLATTTPGLTEDSHPDYSDVLHKAVQSFDNPEAENLLSELVNVYDETCVEHFGVQRTTTVGWVLEQWQVIAQRAEAQA